MALAIDASSPPIKGSGNDPWTTASFTPPNNSLLVVVIMADWFVGTPTISVTSTGLTFTSRRKSGALDAGVVEIFTAEVGSNGGTARTVSGTTTLSADDGAIKVYVLTGYDTSTFVDVVAGAGDVDVNNINASITTTQNNVWVLGGFVDWDVTGNPTSTDVEEIWGNANLDVAAVRKASISATAGAQTLNFNAASGSATTGSWAAIGIREASSGTTHNINQTDAVGVTDTLAKTVTKGYVETAGVSDAIIKNRTKVFNESAGVTDALSKQYLKNFTDFLTQTDSVTTTKASLITPSESMNITDVFAETRIKETTENAGLTDSVAVSQGQGNTDAMGVTDSFVMSLVKMVPGLEDTINVVTTFAKRLVKGFNDPVNITESVDIQFDGTPPPEGPPMSLVDDARTVIGAQLGISGSALAALSIDDLLKMYWSSDFPALHAYDGSESGLAYSPFSTMDHFTKVRATEGDPSLDYIRDVV